MEIIPDSVQNPMLISSFPQKFEHMLVLFNVIEAGNFKVDRILFTNPKPLYYKNRIEIEWLEMSND